MALNLIRTIAAVLTGYLVFAAASMSILTYLWADRDGLVFAGLALAALAGVGLLSGFLVSFIAAKTTRTAGYVVAGLVTLATVANLAMQLGAEPVWYKVGTLLLTVPGILLMTARRDRPAHNPSA